MEKKVQDCNYVFGSSTTTFQRRKKYNCESRCQVIVYMYLQDFFTLKPFHDYSLCSVCSPHSAFCTQPAFYFQSAVCIIHSVCILPLVHSQHSTVHSLHCTLTIGKFINAEGKVQNCILGYSAMQFIIVLLRQLLSFVINPEYSSTSFYFFPYTNRHFNLKHKRSHFGQGSEILNPKT